MDSEALKRLEALEIKAAYTEDLLDELNLTIWRQQQKIDQLEGRVAELQRRGSGDAGDAPRSLRDELPPHY